MSNIGALLGHVGHGIFQNAWVVEDVDAAEQSMHKTLGCGEFTKFVMDEPWILRGKTVSSPLSLGFARSGNLQIELMQPLGTEGVQAEFMNAYGPGPHHVGVLVDDLDASLAVAAEHGFSSPMSGEFTDVRVAFVDTVDELGIFLELLEDPNGMLWATKPWRDERPHVGGTQ